MCLPCRSQEQYVLLLICHDESAPEKAKSGSQYSEIHKANIFDM